MKFACKFAKNSVSKKGLSDDKCHKFARFYTTFIQSATKQNASQSADFQNSLSDYRARYNRY